MKLVNCGDVFAALGDEDCIDNCEQGFAKHFDRPLKGGLGHDDGDATEMGH